jgi:phosphopantothenate-cysteine ligase
VRWEKASAKVKGPLGAAVECDSRHNQAKLAASGLFCKIHNRSVDAMNVVVTGGATIAPIDDVRFMTNVSSGRFAAAITEACLARGGTVWHIHAPAAQLPFTRFARYALDAADPAAELDRLEQLRSDWRAVRDRLHLVPLSAGTVADYQATLKQVIEARAMDVAFLPMAVSDFEPEAYTGKISSDDESLVLRCRRTPKVIRLVRDWSPSIYLVGFKLLSRASRDELIRRAALSCRSNRANLTVANDLQTLRAGQHTLHLVRPGLEAETLEPGDDLAARLVERVLRWAGAPRPEISSALDSAARPR